MKISQMIQREDFYSVNEQTLASFYRHEDGASRMFVYPHINAIITKRPTKAVKTFLYREFAVRSHLFKRLLVKGYTCACVNSMGLLADKRIEVPAHVADSTLIYPCNKKYRIFDFDQKTVSVVVKKGFPTHYFQHEIAFRSREDLPAFVAPLLQYDENGYCEAIIDGCSLARVQTDYDACRDKAYEMFFAYAAQFRRCIDRETYISCLRQQMDELAIALPHVNHDRLHRVADALTARIDVDTLELVFSHGDLQAGNVWIEIGTNAMYIIDWESWGERSVWYDRATLYHGLRPAGIAAFLRSSVPDGQKRIVTMEDIVNVLRELNNLPPECVQDQLDAYLADVEAWLTSSANE